MMWFPKAITLDPPLEGTETGSVLSARSAFRIKEGRLTIHGTKYQLATNSGKNHNHGGVKGFDKVGLVLLMDL